MRRGVHSQLPQAHRHRNQQQIRQPPAARWPRATPHLHTACTRCPLLTPVHTHGDPTRTLARPRYGLCLGARFMACKVAAEAASRQLHAEHLHPMRSGAGARRTSATASTASLPAILRRLAASHHHWPPLRATASSECQGGERPHGIPVGGGIIVRLGPLKSSCLLYTSDAADEL